MHDWQHLQCAQIRTYCTYEYNAVLVPSVSHTPSRPHTSQTKTKQTDERVLDISVGRHGSQFSIGDAGVGTKSHTKFSADLCALSVRNSITVA